MTLCPLPTARKLAMGLPGTQESIACLRFLTSWSSSKDRFIVFVEKANSSLEEIKSGLAASDYLMKTAGAHHTPSAAQVGGGVYAITKAGRETQLAYILTSPSELGEFQKDTGLQHRGSFVTAAKNPQHPGPQNASISESPSYPREQASSLDIDQGYSIDFPH